MDELIGSFGQIVQIRKHGVEASPIETGHFAHRKHIEIFLRGVEGQVRTKEAAGEEEGLVFRQIDSVGSDLAAELLGFGSAIFQNAGDEVSRIPVA